MSVVYIGRLNSEHINLELFISILSCDSNSGLARSRATPGAEDDHQIITYAREYGVLVYEKIKDTLKSNDVMILYCIFGTNLYPIAISKSMFFFGSDNILDDLQNGLVQRIKYDSNNDQKITFTLLHAMIPFLNIKKCSATTQNFDMKWF
jgi:hypothetical protein